MTRHYRYQCHSQGSESSGSGSGRRRESRRARKERVLHTRISEDLAEDIKRMAEDLRVPVSNIVRNVLEEAFTVVEQVTDNMGDLIEDVMDEAESARHRIRERQRHTRGRGRGRHGRRHREEAEPESDEAAAVHETGEAPIYGAAEAPSAPEPVLGWQSLVTAQPQRCEVCATEIAQGQPAYVAVTTQGLAARYGCEACVAPGAQA